MLEITPIVATGLKMNSVNKIPAYTATLNRARRNSKFILIFIFFFSNSSISGERESQIEFLKSEEGKELLRDEWIFLHHHPGNVSIGKTPLINTDRVHMNYRVMFERTEDLRHPRPLGCSRITSGCKSNEIEIIEYKMDCLAEEIKEVRSWGFSFGYYPHQLLGGRPLLQSSSYYGERRNDFAKWTKVAKGTLHKSIADALCKKVLPGG